MLTEFCYSIVHLQQDKTSIAVEQCSCYIGRNAVSIRGQEQGTDAVFEHWLE